MKKIKRYITLLMLTVLTVTSISLPDISVYAETRLKEEVFISIGSYAIWLHADGETWQNGVEPHDPVSFTSTVTYRGTSDTSKVKRLKSVTYFEGNSSADQTLWEKVRSWEDWNEDWLDGYRNAAVTSAIYSNIKNLGSGKAEIKTDTKLTAIQAPIDYKEDWQSDLVEGWLYYIPRVEVWEVEEEVGSISLSSSIEGLPGTVDKNTTVNGSFNFTITSTFSLASYEIYGVSNATVNESLTKNISGTQYSGSIPISVSIGESGETVELNIRTTDINGETATSKASVYVGITAEIPPKPIVDEADVRIRIIASDADPSTPKDEIYEGESIQFEGEVRSGFSPRWKIITNGSSDSGSGTIYESFVCENITKEGEEDYAYQRASYYDYVYDAESGDYKQVTEYSTDYAYFKVKPIKPPVVEVSGDLVENNINILHLEQPYAISTISYDINEPSEQHPTFNVVDEKWQFLDKETGTVVLEGSGLLNDSAFVLNRGVFETEKYYTFRTIAYNEFRPIRRTEHDVEIYIENLPPIVNLNLQSEDLVPPTFAKEPFTINIKAHDVDGIVALSSIEILNAVGDILFLGQDDIKPLGGEYYESNFNYIANEPGLFESVVRVTDEKGAYVSLNLNENIIKPSVYGIIDVLNEETIQKKTNRYIGFDFSNSYENAPFGIDHTKSEIKYRHNDGNWITLSNQQSFENEFVRVWFPHYPNKQTMQMYQKMEGKVDISLIVSDTKDFKSDEVIKTLDIVKDIEPILNYGVESLQHRITQKDVETNSTLSKAITADNIGKGYIKILDNSNSIDDDKIKSKTFYIKYDKANDGYHNDIEYITTVIESNTGYDSGEIVIDAEQNHTIAVKNINTLNLTFLTKENGLGNYYIKAEIKEAITQLPDLSSPLYNEILTFELNAVNADYSIAKIDNLKPRITFEVGVNKIINIIIHYDQYIDAATNTKIEALVKELESKGLTVNLIKIENKY